MVNSINKITQILNQRSYFDRAGDYSTYVVQTSFIASELFVKIIIPLSSGVQSILQSTRSDHLSLVMEFPHCDGTRFTGM